MPFLIDGHNMIGRMPGLSLQDPDDEEALIRLLIGYRARTGKSITVVFDPGASSGVLRKDRYGGVEVIFAAGRGGADALIARRVATGRDPGRWTVVTSDRELAESVAGHGARVRSTADFAAELQAPEGDTDSWKDAPPSPEEVDAWLALFQDQP